MKKSRAELPDAVKEQFREWGKLGGRPREAHVEGCRCARCRREAGKKEGVVPSKGVVDRKVELEDKAYEWEAE